MDTINFNHLFKQLYQGLIDGDQRYRVNNREHITDTEYGIEYHLYDDKFKLTYKEEVIFTDKDATSDESRCLMQVKKMLDNAYIAKNRKTLNAMLEEYKEQSKLPDAEVNPSILS